MTLWNHRTPCIHLVVRYSSECKLGAHRPNPLHTAAFSSDDRPDRLCYLINSWYLALKKIHMSKWHAIRLIETDWFWLDFCLRMYYALSSSVTGESAHVVSVLFLDFICFSGGNDANLLFVSSFGLLRLTCWDFVIFHGFIRLCIEILYFINNS